MNSNMLTTAQAAERLKVSVRRVQALIKSGLIIAQRIGRDWFITEEEISRFEKLPRSAGRRTPKP